MQPSNDNKDPHWEILAEIFFLSQDIQVINNMLAERLAKFQEAMDRLQT